MRPPTPRTAVLVVTCAVATTTLPALAPGAATARPEPPAPVVRVAGDGSVTYADSRADGVRRLDGTLVEYVVESAPSGADGSDASTEAYAVETAAGRLVPVEVRGDLPEQVAGAAVTAEVDASGAVAAAEIEPAPARAVGSAAPSAHRAYVAKVTNHGGYADDDTVIARTIDVALRRWVGETDGAISSFGRVGGFAPYEPTGSCEDPANLWDQAARQAFPRVDFGRGSGNHLVVLAPDGCVFGVAQVGRGLTDGGRLVVSYDPESYLGGLMHEIGHNVGLGHAHSRVCTSGSCTTSDYGNFYDFMGVTWSGYQPTGLDSAQRAQLGVTGSCEAPAVRLATGQRSLSTTYDVFGRGTDVGTRGLAVTDPTTGTRYSLDWRNRAGRDAGGFYGSDHARGTYSGQVNGYGPGLTVQEVDADGDDTTLLPSTESTARGGRAYSRDPGEGFAAGGMRVDVESSDGTGAGQSAQVTVTLTDPSVADGAELPEQSGAVEVTGAPGPGATLTAVTTGWATGTCWRYRWLADGVAVPGARQRTYDLAAGDTERRITVEVVGQAPGFAPRTASSTDPTHPTNPTDPTDPTDPAPPASFASAPTPRITGTPRVGRTLRASVGAWSPSPTSVRYRWSSGGRPIAGATRAAYRVTSATRGTRITLTVTALRSGYATTSRTSRATAAVRR